jgi:hypothetical protein
MSIKDENVEAIRAARQSLTRKFSGLAGWFRHLQDRDRKRQAPAIASRKRASAGKRDPATRTG